MKTILRKHFRNWRKSYRCSKPNCNQAPLKQSKLEPKKYRCTNCNEIYILSKCKIREVKNESRNLESGYR